MKSTLVGFKFEFNNNTYFKLVSTLINIDECTRQTSSRLKIACTPIHHHIYNGHDGARQVYEFLFRMLKPKFWVQNEFNCSDVFKINEDKMLKILDICTELDNTEVDKIWKHYLESPKYQFIRRSINNVLDSN